VYFHNVRVNGILPDANAMSLWVLLALLNSRLLDWVFRRGAAEHANEHFAANKQFIKGLPIREPDGGELEVLGQALYDRASALGAERDGFLVWLAGRLGRRLPELNGYTALEKYETAGTEGVLDVLSRNSKKLEGKGIGSRAFREELQGELTSSADRLSEMASAQAKDEVRADDLVYELYELTADQRAAVNAEYD
jgi:hypothetical protein